jgi:hypothetical protein
MELLVAIAYPPNVYYSQEKEAYICRSLFAGEDLKNLSLYRCITRVKDGAWQIFKDTHSRGFLYADPTCKSIAPFPCPSKDWTKRS